MVQAVTQARYHKRCETELNEYKRNGRPYLVACGIEDGIKFIFTMSPVMAKIASEADLFNVT